MSGIAKAIEPRSIKLDRELGDGERGTAVGVTSYGLDEEKNDDPNLQEPDRARTNTILQFKYWRATIWGPPHGAHENRIYELSFECGQDYPLQPPVFQFISKIKIPGVNQQNGKLDNNAIEFLRQWPEIYQQWKKSEQTEKQNPCSIDSALKAIRKHMEQHKRESQPPEGSKYEV